MKNTKDVYGALGTTSLLSFDPETLVIVTDKAHPLFDERALLEPDESMILNVMAHGVIQPITVRKNTETAEVEVVYGRQRTKALCEANKRLAAQGLPIKYLPARVTKAEGAALAAMVVIENEIRKDDTPLNRAAKMSRLREIHGMADDQIAIVFGCTVQTVRAMSALLGCAAVVRSAVDAGKINMSHALKLAKLGPADQREKVAELIAAGDGAKGHEKARKQRAVIEPAVLPMRKRKEVEERLGRCIPDGTEAGLLRWVLGQDDPPPAAAIDLMKNIAAEMATMEPA